MAESNPVPRFLKLTLAQAPSPILTVVGASNRLLGSVMVIVGAEAYADPGSVTLIANILESETNARALAVAPSIALDAAVVDAEGIIAHMLVWLGLPFTASSAPVPEARVIALVVHTMPSSELLMLLLLLCVTKKTPCP